MTTVHESPPDGKSQKDWLSEFSKAYLRIASKLDLDSVLQEVIDSARSVTDARYGALITFDDSGGIRSLVTSGITPEVIRRLGALPKGLGILGYLNEIDGPLRLADIASHPRSVGFPKNHPPMKTFLGSPVRHQGERLGNIYLTEKEGGREFSREDEDILVMFASHVALLMANARRHLEERQARADLEALVNISPVGILVFDRKTGDLISTNDEVRRIVGKVNSPGRALSELLETMTLRRPDGRDIPVDELPTTKAMRSGETVLADEVVIHLQDGRAITALVNARPVRGEDGEIVSVVATLQDMSSLEKMKRQRTDFLESMSHNLRTPLTAIKGSAATMLGSLHSLDAVETRQLLRIIDEQSDHIRQLINDLVDMTHIEAGTLPVTLEPVDLKDLVQQAREEFADGGVTDRIELDLAPDLPRVMADGRRILYVLSTFLKSIAEHYAESPTIRVSASTEDLYVSVTVEAGAGVPPANRFPYRLDNRFSRRNSDGSGRRSGEDNLGLAICKGIVQAHGGRMSAEIGGPHPGARFEFTIPAVDEVEYGAENGPAPPSAYSRDPDRGQVRILTVESDPEVRRYILNALSEAGFTPVAANDPDEIELLAEAEDPQLLIVESMPLRCDASRLMERIRRTSDAPVIFLSANGSGQNMELAFELGAADYLVKPFTPTELVARTKAALRRRLSSSRNEPFVMGDLTIDYSERRVTVAGRPVQLTATEYRLLFELSNAAGRVLTYEQLLRRAWGPLYSTDTRIVHTFVKQLRGKLGDDARCPKYIFTEPRVGYSMPRPPKPVGRAGE